MAQNAKGTARSRSHFKVIRKGQLKFLESELRTLVLLNMLKKFERGMLLLVFADSDRKLARGALSMAHGNQTNDRIDQEYVPLGQYTRQLQSPVTVRNRPR